MPERLAEGAIPDWDKAGEFQLPPQRRPWEPDSLRVLRPERGGGVDGHPEGNGRSLTN